MPSPGKRDEIRRHYEHRITPDRANFDVLDWASADSQHRRFDVLIRHVLLDGRTLLDVGCGLGDLYAVLRERGIPVDYTGVDILEPMVRTCRERYGEGRFLRADVFGGEPVPGQPFDVVFTSGVFNLNLGNNLQFLPAAVHRLLELTRSHLVFNLLHARQKTDDERYFFYRPREVLEFLEDEPCEVRILDDYLPNDFTVICRKR